MDGDRRAVVTRYRVTLFGKPKGQWKANRAEAEEYAIKHKLASRDEYEQNRHRGPVVYLGVGVKIEPEPG